MNRLAAVLLFSAVTAGAQSPLAELRAAAGAAGAAKVVTVPPARSVGPGGRHRPGQDDGRENAASACLSAAFDSDRQACMRTVSAAYYFDAGAVAVCRKVSFSSEMPRCITAIADKAYLRAETELCGKSFSSGIIACFQNAGRPERGGRDGDAYTVRQLRRIARRLREGDIYGAQRELDELIDSLDDGRP